MTINALVFWLTCFMTSSDVFTIPLIIVLSGTLNFYKDKRTFDFYLTKRVFFVTVFFDYEHIALRKALSAYHGTRVLSLAHSIE